MAQIQELDAGAIGRAHRQDAWADLADRKRRYGLHPEHVGGLGGRDENCEPGDLLSRNPYMDGEVIDLMRRIKDRDQAIRLLKALTGTDG